MHVTVTGSEQVKTLDDSYEGYTVAWPSPLGLHSGPEGPRMVARGQAVLLRALPPLTPGCALEGVLPATPQGIKRNGQEK